MPSRKIVQCRMSSVQGAVNTRPLCIKSRDGRYSKISSTVFYREKVTRYRVYGGTCFVIVVTKAKHAQQSN